MKPAMKSKVYQPPREHAEQFQLLKYRMMAMLNGNSGQPLVINFTGYRKGEGVSTLVTNFALTLSDDPEIRILLVDFNLQQPSLYRFFQNNGKGSGSADPDQIVSADEVITRDRQMVRTGPRLDVIISKRKAERDPDPAGIEDVERFMVKAKEHYDFILIDGPPLYGNSFANLLAAKADYTVLVVKAHGVRLQVLRNAVNDLERLGANMLGVILNKRSYPIPNFIYRML
jgi:Mrp family chromosome partitioning ATPase